MACARRHLLPSPMFLLLITFSVLTAIVCSQHPLRHFRGRVRRQQGANLYLPGSYVTDGGESPDLGPWEEWSAPSECSRSCGGGVTTQTRVCQPGYTCQGPTQKHFSCNTQDCPDYEDFRSQQCSEFDSQPFEEVYYQWIPYTKAPNPCELNCMPRGERFYFTHRKNVTDGTKCNEKGLDVCVQGKCQPVGCDMMLGSDAREDKCRVCRGDGSTCNTLTGRFDTQDLQPGYNDILIIPGGATNIRVEEIAPSNNYLAIRNQSGYYYLNGNWRIDFPRTTEFAGSAFTYEREPQGFSAPDKITCLGPTNEPLFIVLLSQDKNVGVDYEYSSPNKIQTGSESEIYAWTFDQFGACSASCGGGLQYRNVKCAGRDTLEPVDRALCDSNTEPANVQECSSAPCDAQWVPYPWGKCDAECGEDGQQVREIICQRLDRGAPQVVEENECSGLPKPAESQPCSRSKICPKWHIGPWKPCDHLCGDGVQVRKVRCFTKNGTHIDIVDDQECIDPKPETEKECNLRPCEGVDWMSTEWSGCESKCDLVNETRKVHCASISGKIYPDELCESESKPLAVRKCETANNTCEYRWYASQWSECSAKCGEGVQTRELFCGSLEEDVVKKVDKSNCDQTKKYETMKNCTGTEDCGGEWFSGPWSECSKECGAGEKIKKVVCLLGNEVNPTACDANKIPFSQETCNKQPCSEDTIIPVDSTKSVDESEPTKPTEEALTTTETTETSEIESTTENVEGTTTTEENETTIEPELLATTLPEDDDEYEIVASDECEDGEWVYGGINKDVTRPLADDSGIELSTDSSTTSEDTESSLSSLSTDELMLSDSPSPSDTTGTDLFSTDTGSGDDELSTKYLSTDFSMDTTLEGSGNSEETTPAITTELSTSTEESSTTESGSTSEISTDTEEFSSETATSNSPTTEVSVSSEASTSSITTSEATATSTSTDITSTSDSSDTAATSESVSTEFTVTATSSEISSVSTDSSSITSEITENSSSFSTTELDNISTTGIVDSTTEEFTEPNVVESNIGAKEVSETTELEPTEGSTSTEFSTELSSTSESSTELSSESTLESSTTEQPGSSTETSQATESTTEFTGSTESTEVTESTSEVSSTTEVSTEITGSTEYSTTESGSTEESSETTPITEIFLGKSRLCKRKKQKDCKKSKYGCCWDKITPAKGPFDKDCPLPKTCKESKFGCCEDGVSPALGKKFKGCPPTHCNETLFGCCPDKKTPAEGNNKEGCPPPPPACLKSKYGCCKDNITAAKGPKQKGCQPDKIKPTVQCANTTYGCCPDGVKAAEGEYFKGCDIFKKNCNESYFQCCPDGVTSAEGPNFKGCKSACSNSTYGCCTDGVTPAHGYSGEGCCLASAFGCCPDNITPARGVNFVGCGCQYSGYGCCPDNQTASRGPNNEGCGCKFTEHGCCPDEYTPAYGPDYQGCLCHTFQFGCCSDGITIAKGPHQQGCGCEYTEFGCCSDEQTPAQGPNKLGCGCDSSKYGCCIDGVSEAQGENFEGCEIVPINKQESCSLDKERGSCRNYTVKWFYDMNYGGCSRFWYGGCDGNANRYRSKDECEHVCVEPEGNDRCKLPKVAGPCEGYYPSWYYNSNRKYCEQFIYGGCLGNNNRFESREECSQLCETDTSADSCEQPKEEGPCKGNYRRWYFDKESSTCQEFAYGGCKGNNNNFATEQSCKQKCAFPDRKKEKDECHKPAEIGDCANYTDRFYYDTRDKACRHFYYGGCGGNGNNFVTQEACQHRCEQNIAFPVTQEPVVSQPEPQEPFRTEYCFEPSLAGDCRASYLKYFYDRNDGVCKAFTYGGCNGNRNNFESLEECYQYCGNAQDLCTLPPTVGQCNGEYTLYYYDTAFDTCKPFSYGGCGGNYNRFPDAISCEQRCKRTPPVAPTQPATQAPAPTEAFCYEEPDAGNCSDVSQVAYFFDSRTRRCTPFSYTGCGGNNNRFGSEEQCERLCGNFVGQDVCSLERDQGPCDQYYPKYYYNRQANRCAQFVYGGCGGNGNRFSSLKDCESLCITNTETSPNGTNTAEPTDIPPHKCQAQFDLCPTMQCPYGVEAFVDQDQCNVCQCRDPCKTVSCGEYTKCVIDYNRNKTTKDDYDFIALCRQINKVGKCPNLETIANSCDRECNDDADCALDYKCCPTQCGTTCASVDNGEPGSLVNQTILPAYTPPSIQQEFYAPQVIEEDYRPQVQGELGDQVTLNCAVRGNPNPAISWSKDGLEIDRTQAKYRLKLDQTLQIITLHETDSGLYLCTADNNLGEPLVNKIQLDVRVPIWTNITLQEHKFPIGTDLTIPCDVRGGPTPQVSWYKDGVKIVQSDRVNVVGDNVLIVRQADKVDSGTYECEAINQYGRSSSTVTILVEGMYIDPNCTDNQFFANCALIVRSKFCTHKYYAKFCCRSCTEAGLLPVDGSHLQNIDKYSPLANNLV